MNKSILFIPVFFLLSFSSNAQFEMGIHFNPSFPLGDFKEKNPDLILWGFQMEGLWNLPNSPIKVGVGTGYTIYGSRLERERYLEISQATMRVRRNNNVWTSNAILRIDPVVNGPVRPYIQGVAGANLFYTRVKIRPRFGAEIFDAETEFSDWAFFYGGGAGLRFPIPNSMISIDARADYLVGDKARYMVKQSAVYDRAEGSYTINPVRSGTDMLRFFIGINILLD